jgi:hypothetical protein
LCGSNDYARRRLHSTFQSSYIDPSDSQIWESCCLSIIVFVLLCVLLGVYKKWKPWIAKLCWF